MMHGGGLGSLGALSAVVAVTLMWRSEVTSQPSWHVAERHESSAVPRHAGAEGDASSRPASFHRGQKGASDGSDHWDDCTDQSGLSIVKPLSASIDAKGNVSINPKSGEVTGVFGAARAICFMQDTAHLDGKPTFQHEEKQLSGISLWMRPAANIAAIKVDTISPGHGLVVADYKNVTSGGVYAWNGTKIPASHSVLLWFGKTDDGVLYSAVLDLKLFPSVNKPHFRSDLKPLEITKLHSTDPPEPPVNTVAIARWTDPHHKWPVGKRSHDGSWVDCNAGCCVATEQ